MCLVTGKYGMPVDTTTATMIPGSQATAKLVAFQVNSGYDSYGKKNVPMPQYPRMRSLHILLRSMLCYRMAHITSSW